MVTEVNQTWWFKSIEKAVEQLRRAKQPSLKQFSKGKPENQLTSLLTAHLLASDKEIVALNEVKQSRLAEERSTFSIGQSADLMIFDRKNINWEEPKVYAEFKFWYNFDIDTEGKLTPKDERDTLADTNKLSMFKKNKKNTTCLQGIYFCFSDGDKPDSYMRKSNRAGFEKNHERFIEYFVSTVKLEIEPQCEVTIAGIFPLAEEKRDGRPTFWLDLLLFEIR